MDVALESCDDYYRLRCGHVGYEGLLFYLSNYDPSHKKKDRAGRRSSSYHVKSDIFNRKPTK